MAPSKSAVWLLSHPSMEDVAVKIVDRCHDKETSAAEVAERVGVSGNGGMDSISNLQCPGKGGGDVPPHLRKWGKGRVWFGPTHFSEQRCAVFQSKNSSYS